MALTIEDGTGLADATSFVTVDEYKAYASARGFALPVDPQIEINAIKSMDYFKSLEDDFSGERLTEDQALPFPRTGQYIYNVLIEDGDIPQQVKDAQNAVMATIAQGIELFPASAERALKRTKTGPLEKEWFDANTSPSVPLVDAALAPLFGESSSFSLTVRRV